MVGGCQGGERALLGPIREQAIAHRSRLGLNVGGWRFAPVRKEDEVRDVQPFAHGSYHLGFATAFRAQSVIDRRGFNQSGAGSGYKQEKGEAVRAARYRDADAFAGRNKRIEIGGEALYRLIRRGHSLNRTWPRPWHWEATP